MRAEIIRVATTEVLRQQAVLDREPKDTVEILKQVLSLTDDEVQAVLNNLQ